MAKTDNLTDFLTGVANAIRTKKGTTAKINPQNFETEIGSITTSKPEQEKMISLVMSSGNQIVLPDSGKVLSKVTIIKPTSLVPENIKKGVDIGDVIGTLEVTSKPEQEKIATPSNVQQIISPDADMTLSKVTIKAAPLPALNNDRYKNVDGCLIENKNKILLLGSSESIIPSDGSITSIGDYAFSGCRGLINITIPNSVTSIGSDAFFGCWSLTSIIIPDSVTNIGKEAFWGCDGLTSVTIGGGITSIEEGVFRGCPGLTDITIPDSVTSIGSVAFMGCKGLISVIIPDNVKTMGERLFSGCIGLTSAIIGSGVTSIGWDAFDKCSSLTNVTMLPITPPQLGREAFPSNVTTITVPAGCGEAYKAADGWNVYADKIVEAAA